MAKTEIETIKTLALIAMVSDDELMDRLVLKGGNAIELVYKLDGRASKDLDFSMPSQFEPQDLTNIERRIRRVLEITFSEAGYSVFDVKMEERPEIVTEDLENFWGGYRVEFKVLSKRHATTILSDKEKMRRNALVIGGKGKFIIDISKFEYCSGKKRADVEGYTVYVYTPEMIVFEKLRAICQQMPEYTNIVRDRGASARARDFYDSYLLLKRFPIDLRSTENRELLGQIFGAKRVPLSLLERLPQVREFHRPDFESVRNTVRAGTQLEAFDFYFDYIIQRVSELESFWVEQVPP